jgi:hypothetical protein
MLRRASKVGPAPDLALVYLGKLGEPVLRKAVIF